MAYLVTGGTGYIGSYVVRDLLKVGKKVVCLQRSGITQVAREVIGEDKLRETTIIQGDVSNLLQLLEIVKEHEIDCIVHAGYSIPPGSEHDPATALRVNSVGMNNVLEAVRLFGVRRVVWTSSSNALGTVFQYYKDPVPDDAVYKPVTMYGATKVLNEFMCKLYFDQFKVDSIGFRLPRVYGIGRWHGAAGVFTEFLRKAALNIPQQLDDADHTNDFVYIDDVSAFIAAACEIPTTRTRVFNVAEGDYSNRQVVEVIHRINPMAPIELVKPQPGVVKGYVLPKLDDTGLRTELGWSYKYDIEAGLRKCLNIIREREGLTLF